MEYMDKNIQTSIDDDGILLARIDMPGRAMNVFSLEMMDSLEHLQNHVDGTDAVKAVVITSGKSTFLVGADLEMIRMFTEEARTGAYEALHALFGRLSRIFRRLEKSTKPYVAAINGLALGGGLEVTLACHGRVVADDKAVQLGLPEIKLGLLPGAGGTQRLPRLIDTGEAMRMLLTGDSVSPARALELGLVHELVAPDRLIDAAKRCALALSDPRAPWDIPDHRFDPAPFDFSKPDVCDKIAAFVGVTEQQRARYPAFDAIMKCVAGGWNRAMDDACHWEMDVFVDLIRNPVAGNMVRTLFLNRQRAVKEGLPPESMSAFLSALKEAQTSAQDAGCNEDEVVLAVALAAARVWLEGGVADVDTADVAAVLSGMHPAYTGGPFTYLCQSGLAEIKVRTAEAAQRQESLFSLPARSEDLFKVLAGAT